VEEKNERRHSGEDEDLAAAARGWPRPAVRERSASGAALCGNLFTVPSGGGISIISSLASFSRRRSLFSMLPPVASLLLQRPLEGVVHLIPRVDRSDYLESPACLIRIAKHVSGAGQGAAADPDHGCRVLLYPPTAARAFRLRLALG
jgi:hypothetical protein